MQDGGSSDSFDGTCMHLAIRFSMSVDGLIVAIASFGAQSFEIHEIPHPEKYRLPH
jgi:hypothetical protein